ncbi:MAG: hypothetical protein OXH77_12805 [Anaerolineaceae bacterium]|nr:hypothetical protein [Anaerolineaceae bacterium]
MKMLRVILPLCALLIWQLPALRAHQPFCEFADLTAATPWQVPDASISHAYFGNVYPAGDIDYFSFEATAGQPVLISLSIPAIDGVDVYAPLLLVFGPGVSGPAGLDLPAAPEIPEGQGAALIPLGDEPDYFYEPFGRKYFWNWQDSIFVAPQTAAYTVALWHPRGEIGRYTFVIGQREVLGGEADCFATYGEYWTPLVEGVNPYRDTIIHDGMMHDHGKGLEVDAENAPEVDLQLIPLAGGGFNLRVQTLNFEFTPQKVDLEPLPNEGHAHLYVDGEKIARLYGEWFHLPALPEAAETLTVTLHANDHSVFTRDGIEISASLSLADLRQEQGLP